MFYFRTISGRRISGLLAVTFALLAACGSLCAQFNGNWRVYKAADGLRDSASTWVTVSPRGNVWVSHGQQKDAISRLDGYSVKIIPAAGEGNYPVFESRSGQLWCVYNEGLMLYNRGTWVAHPIEEIRTAMVTDVMRKVRSIPLIPAEVDHAFILLPDKLIEFDAATQQISVIRPAKESRLERFSEMVEARDGGIWITGLRGLAKIPGPSRQIRSSTAWEEYVVDGELDIQNLQRPFEDDAGGITTIGETATSATRLIVHFDGRAWSVEPTQVDKIRLAWKAFDGGYWAVTRDSLFLIHQGQKEVVERPEFAVTHFFDVATERGGVFWMATSDGLVRHSRTAWQPPPRLSDAASAVYGACEDTSGRLWFADATGLFSRQNDDWEKFRWPNNFESYFGLQALPGGLLIIGAHDRPILFDPAVQSFRSVQSQGERQPGQLVGRFRDGTACLYVPATENPSHHWSLEKFDGHRFTTYLEAKPEWRFSDDLTVVHEAENGDLWLGGNNGLALYREGKMRLFGAKDGLPTGRANYFEEVDGGKIWCGVGDSLMEFDGKNWSFQRPGFDRIHTILKTRNGSVWVTSGSGLFRYQDGSWVGINVEEGLPSSVVYTVLEDRRGNIWAGTARGVALYQPGADIEPPHTIVTRTTVPQESSDSELTTVAFRGSDKWKQTPSERLLYSYRIDGASWSTFSQDTTVTFPDLAAGKHRVDVRAMDRNWNIERTPATIDFDITLPWRRDPRLITISIVGLAVTVFFAGLAINGHLRLRRGYAEIEKIVSQRTEQLHRANQELLHSQKMKALGTLAAGVAHDFNNILSIVKGSAQIIEANLENKDKVLVRVSRIKTVADQGTAIVKTILGLSQATVHAKAPYEVNTLLTDTARLLGDKFLSGITLIIEKDPELPALTGVKDLVQQILLNFLVNASEAMGGHGRIILRAIRMHHPPADSVLIPAASKGYVEVSVEDFGSGIPPEILPRIFEPFFTTKALSTRRGTGLGLSMVYELAKEMGCGIHVISEPGTGSTFSIILPVSTSETTTDTKPTEPTASTSLVVNSLKDSR